MEKNKYSQKTEIIAEIANAHQGDSNNAEKLAIKSFLAGADAVKFQIYFAEELLAENHPRFEHFKKQSFAPKIWSKIFKSLKKRKIKIYCDIFGEKALKVASENQVDGYKIHSSDLTNSILLNLIKKNKKRIFLSTGGSTINEISYAVRILKKEKIKPILLHGFQSYPTQIENCDLSRITLFKKIFGDYCEIGYQDHLSGDNPLNFSIPLIALGMGARFLEKHVTLDRSKKGVDYYSSLEPKELAKFVNLVRESEKGIGKNPLLLSNKEKNYRDNVKKVWFLRKPVKKGKIIKEKNLIMKRPANGIVNCVNIEDLVNKKALIDINCNKAIKRSQIQNKIAALIVVRTDSKRLPKKALKKICGLTTIEHLINRVKQSKKINKIILCTTQNKKDDVLEKIAKKMNIKCFRGNEKDVLKRMLDAVKNTKTDLLIRITGDDILIDPEYLDLSIHYHLNKNLQYTDAKNLPSGTEVEVFDHDVLKLIYNLAEDTSGTEYLTYYLKNHKHQFRTGSLEVKKKHRKNLRLTLDTKKDLIVIKNFLINMKSKKKLFNYRLNDILKFYKNNRKIFKINKNLQSKKIFINTNLKWENILKQEA